MSTRRNRRSATREELLQALFRAGREHSDATVMFHSAVAEHMGLNVTEVKTISFLDRLGPLTAGDIANRTGLASASVTSLIDRLETKGLVHRVRDANDRRRVIVELLPERMPAIASLFDSFARSLSKLVARYRNEELAAMLDFLVRATEVAHEETVRLTDPSKRLDRELAVGPPAPEPPPGHQSNPTR